MIVLEFIVIGTMFIGLILAARQLAMAAVVMTGSVSALDLRQPRLLDGSETPGAVEADWPTVTVVVPAHNEERVIGGCLEAMITLDYPRDRLNVLVIDDRSEDASGALADAFARRDGRVKVLHRAHDAQPGKSAAIADAMALVTTEVVVLFDADYLPRPELLKQLVAPFRDPGVGATMGRVVPYNSDVNVLTRLLDLERRAGYAVDQNARAMWKLVPQFGGTVGGIRVSALADTGGWRQGLLAEDTDLTFRLILKGWRVKYLNDAACYEEVPEDWRSRFRQVRRWAYGHNECLMTHFASVASTGKLRLSQKLDALLILLFYLFPVLSVASVGAAVLLLAYGPADGLVCYACAYLAPVISLAVLAPYIQASVAAVNDRQPHILRVLPLLFVSSSLSLIASSAAFVLLLRNRCQGGGLAWDKTRRFRSA